MLAELKSLQFGEFTLDRHKRELRRLDTLLPVSGKAFDLLLYMAANAGRPLSKSELLEAVWPDASVEESNLSQNVFLLRKVLGSSSDGPIKTLPGRGYQFVAQIKETQPAGPADSYALPAAPAVTSVSLETTHTRMIVERSIESHLILAWKPLAVVAVIALLLGGGLLAYRHSRRSTETADSSSPPVPAAAQARRTVAVLGFRNISSRPEDSWLSTAVAEMLASEMSTGDRLRIIPNEEVAHAQADLDVHADTVDSDKARSGLLHATGADMLVHGAYVVVDQGTSPALRLMVQVEDTHSGKSVASFSETGNVGGLFQLVDQAGTELRRDLADSGSRTDDEHALSGMSQSTDAMRFYAEGVEQARRFDSHGARSLFESAVLADPGFALAHLGLADAWADLGYSANAAKEATEAYKLSDKLPKAQRLAIEADYRKLSNDDEHAVSIYKALATFYPDDASWGMKLAAEQRENGQQKDAVATLEELRKFPLTPSQTVEVDSIEAAAYSHIDDTQANDKARTLAEEAISIADKQGGLLLHGQAFKSKCFILSHIGPVPDGRAACELAKTTFQAIGNMDGVASASNNLGVLSEKTGNWKLAETEYQESRNVWHQIGNFQAEVDAMQNLAQLSLSHGELQAALEESIALSRVTGTSDDYHTAYEGHHYAATALELEGLLAKADAEALAAQQAADKEHAWDFKVYQQARSRDVRGWIALDAGEVDKASALFDEALSMLRPTHDPVGEAIFTADEAAIFLDRGPAPKQVLDGLRQAIAVLSKFQDESDQTLAAKTLLAQLDVRAGAVTEAAQSIVEARALDSRGDSFATHLSFLEGEADVQSALGQTAEAHKFLQQVVSEAKAKGFAYVDLEAEIALARLDQKASPSAQSATLLADLGRRAEHAGFKGLARRAAASKG